MYDIGLRCSRLLDGAPLQRLLWLAAIGGPYECVLLHRAYLRASSEVGAPRRGCGRRLLFPQRSPSQWLRPSPALPYQRLLPDGRQQT